MRLGAFSTSDDPRVRLGVVDGDGVEITELQNPTNLVDLIETWDMVRSAVEAAAAAGSPRPVEMVRLHAPLVPRRNVFCIGKNYRAHAAEMSGGAGGAGGSAGEPDLPIVFTKAPTTVIGPGEAIPAHASLTSQLDYEAELAVVIGVGGRAIAPDDALRHVWGYTVVNDVTARDLQQAHKQWFLGKSLDGACPMGPWVATADAFDVGAAEVRCLVNGELRQLAPVADMIFDIPTLVATISAGLTLQPGDVIATGTPAGVGAGMTPPTFLVPGDEVVCEVTGVGALRNIVGD